MLPCGGLVIWAEPLTVPASFLGCHSFVLAMADSALSSDLEPEGLTPMAMESSAPKPTKAKSKSKVPRAHWAHAKGSSAQEKTRFGATRPLRDNTIRPDA